MTDICLILEGTYPYVAGGVSSWVHELVTNLSEFSYSLAVILPNRNTPREAKYDLPGNVKKVHEIFLHDLDLPRRFESRLQNDAWDELREFHECPFGGQKFHALEGIYRNFFDADTRGFAPADLPKSRQAWEILASLYEEKAADQSFIDYFWTFRFMHYPLFKIMSAEVPRASVYHTVSTGYAGLLATVAKLKYNRPMLLTEHGIYTRERRIEISRADWIYERDSDEVKVRRSQSRFKDLWNSMFTTLSKITYHYADAIVTLFKGNQKYQIADGADPEKMLVIPNGVDVETLQTLARVEKADPEEFVLGFMGRVVSIKDVKTFIRACKRVVERVPKLRVYIMGPTDEEEAYFHECVRLTEFLGLKNIVTFTGKVDVTQFYPKLDLLVLTSISEAQPLVILEAHCLGIPAIATDVGACREMLYGQSEEDGLLGKSGIVAGVTNAEEIAQAIIRIWQSPTLRSQMAEAAKKRVAKYYNRGDLDNKYRQLYEHFMIWKAGNARPVFAETDSESARRPVLEGQD